MKRERYRNDLRFHVFNVGKDYFDQYEIEADRNRKFSWGEVLAQFAIGCVMGCIFLLGLTAFLLL